MANVRISQLPVAPDAITGAELVPIVQNGQTVQTTVSDLVSAPSQDQTFATISAESSLPNSRYLSGGLGIGTSDGGAQGPFSFFLNGTSASLENASTGIIVKSGVNTVVNRQIQVGTAGLGVTNGNGISGNPTVSLTNLALSIATLTGNGMVSLVGGSYFQNVTLTGTADQISIANPNGGSNPTFSIADNPTLPGTSAVLLPRGNTSQRVGVPTTGMFRYNTQTEVFEGYTNTGWNTFSVTGGVTSFSAGTTGFTPSIATTGAVTLAGTLNVANGGTGAVTLTGYVYGNGTSAMTASLTIPTTDLSGTITNAQLANSSITIGSTTVSLGTSITTLTAVSISGSTNTLTNIGNSSLTNSAITINGSSVSLGGSITVTATASNALTIGTGLSGTSYNGSAAVTIAIANTGVTAATYGSASAVPVFAVNAQGQITSVTNTSISIASSAITDKGLANGVASLDGSGTVPTSQLPAAVLGALNYQGTWNASTNTPTLTSSVGTKGYYYVVNVAGSTNLNGITDWLVGDWAVFNGSVWQKIDNTESVTSVNGYTGAVVLSYSDVGAPSTSGTNATGTWSISINGNAATATSATTATTATNVAGGAAGSLVYQTGSGATTTLALGTTNYVLTAGASAPQYTAQSSLSVGSATNASNVNVSAGSGTLNYLTFVTATSGNTPVLLNTGLTYNSSTNAITGGISGGTF